MKNKIVNMIMITVLSLTSAVCCALGLSLISTEISGAGSGMDREAMMEQMSENGMDYSEIMGNRLGTSEDGTGMPEIPEEYAEMFGGGFGTYSGGSLDISSSLTDTGRILLIAGIASGVLLLTLCGIFMLRRQKYEIAVMSFDGKSKGEIVRKFAVLPLLLIFLASAVGSTVGIFSSPVLSESLIEKEREQMQSQMSESMSMTSGDRSEMFAQMFGGELPEGMELPEGFSSEMFGSRGNMTEYSAENTTSVDIAAVLLWMAVITAAYLILFAAVSAGYIYRYDPREDWEVPDSDGFQKM